jgi:hypothetical protein
MWKILWRRNLLWFWPSAAVGFAGAGLGSYFVGHGSLLWFPAALVLFEGLLFAYSFWKVSQRARKQPPAPLDFRLMKSSVQYSNDRSSHTVPWDTFKCTRRDDKNLYLFVTKLAAIAVPTDTLTEDAVEFIIAQVGNHQAT